MLGFCGKFNAHPLHALPHLSFIKGKPYTKDQVNYNDFDSRAPSLFGTPLDAKNGVVDVDLHSCALRIRRHQNRLRGSCKNCRHGCPSQRRPSAPLSGSEEHEVGATVFGDEKQRSECLSGTFQKASEKSTTRNSRPALPWQYPWFLH